MAPGCVPSSLQTNQSLLAAEAKRERVLHTTPKEKKAVANKERIYNQHRSAPFSEPWSSNSYQVYSAEGADAVI